MNKSPCGITVLQPCATLLQVITVLLFTVVWVASASSVAATRGTDLQFTRLLSEQGISVGALEAVYQDSYGYMWFGGDADSGLVQYDGYSFTIHRHEPENPRSLSSSIVWDVYEDRFNVLWVATDSGINRFDRATGEFTRFKPNSKDAATEAFTRAIVEDDQGRLWVASFGGILCFDRDSGTFQAFDTDPDDPQSISSNQIRSLLPDGNGGLWVGTNTTGLNHFDIKTRHVKRYPYGEHAKNGTRGSTILSLHQSSDGILWIGTDAGLSRMNPVTGEITNFSEDSQDPDALSQNIVGAIAEDQKGNLWLGTEYGLNYLDLKTGKFTVYLHNPNRPRSLANNVVRSLFLDDRDNLWIGNFPAGVNFLDSANVAFSTYRHDPGDSNSLSQSSVLAVHEDADGGLWIGTDGGGISRFDRKEKRFTHYPYQPGIAGALTAGAILSVERAHEGKLWLGTWGGGVNLFDPRTGKSKGYWRTEGAPAENVWALTMDGRGDVWAGSIGGGVQRYHREDDRFVWYEPNVNDPDSLPSYVVWSVFEDHAGQIWLGTGEGLARYRPATDDFETFAHDPALPSSLSADVVTHIAEDSAHRLWIATRGGGLNLYDRETQTFSQIDHDDGLPSDVIVSVVPDDYGNIWLGTTNGLSRYTPATGRIMNYNQANGLQGNQFNIGSAVKLRSGELVFGGIYGFTLFDPRDFGHTGEAPPVEIVDFEIFNRPVTVGAEGSPLVKTISQTHSLTLTHKQSVFSFTFAALSYSNPDKNQYAYMLEGFEDQWNYIGNRRNATYTNLNPGSYVFKVRAANAQGIWNNEGQSIALHILPPPWRTWWAYSLYAFIIIGILASFVWAQQKKVSRERDISRRLQQLDKLKDEFLANTSHELRTPLNGIIGLAESLVDGVGGAQSDISKNNLQMIVASGKRLDRLVNDILDFSQLKEQSLTLHRKPVDMHALVQVVLALSEPLAAKQNLQLSNAVNHDVPAVYADEDRVQQILHNLIGNAIKFTHGGTVAISAQVRASDMLEIAVQDTGIGIAPDALPNIFDAFQQAQGDVDRSYGGTGLGLAVTKQLVELHGGTIEVESTPQRGSRFTFSLPLVINDNVVVTPSDDLATGRGLEKTHENSGKQFVDASAPAMGYVCASPGVAQHHILVVDDEPVNRQVLVNHLHLQNYLVTQASNGREALDLVAEQHFDLILLDIMMPQLSGYEVCKQLRQQFSSHELPIIFLTAKSQDNDLVTGFSLGANDFLTKPINRDELLARVNTHLQLLEINRDLEKKIGERTDALQQKHQQLEQAYQQLEKISLSDPLTGLNNRRYLQKLIPMDIAKVQREYRRKQDVVPAPETGQDLVFFLLDIDHFKPVNDEHGHSAGDQLLIQISNLLTQLSRDSDCLVRWGGEEFLIVSRFCDRDEAPQMAERIRQAILSTVFRLSDGQELRKTCSIGFACYPFVAGSPSALSWEQVIDTADRALYAAKRSGRNRCVGLAATETTPVHNLYRYISEDIQGLANRGEVAVIGEREDLEWD